MRILILGAGGTGGYFGGRLVQAGCDVNFLVRPARAARLRADGLIIRSPLGDAQLQVATVEPAALTPDYDLVLLSCKGYDLADAIKSLAPAMQRPGVTLLPVLNGLAHFDALDAAFGKPQVLGGLCLISTSLNAAGEIVHFAQGGTIVFGERDPGARSDRCDRIAATFAPAKFESRHSTTIVADLWEKFAFMAAGASLTCLMRASVGDIVASAEGARVAHQLAKECADIARASGYAPRTRFAEDVLTAQGSAFKTSMLRDIEAGRRIEVDHLVADMLRRGRELQQPTELLEVAVAHLRAYERSAALAKS